MSVFKYRTLVPDIEFWMGMIPCQAACPVKTDAGKYVQLIAEGKFKESYLTARSPNPFASVCGRVCAAPCEDACRRGRIDAPITIRALKRFVTEKYGVESMEPDTQDDLRQGVVDEGNKRRGHLPVLQATRANVARGQKVAVIGAGPAGIAAAHDLALMGYRVTVFEATNQAGGMMYHGIPEFRLARSIIEKAGEQIPGLGESELFVAGVVAWITTPAKPKTDAVSWEATHDLIRDNTAVAPPALASLSVFVKTGEVPRRVAERVGYEGEPAILASRVTLDPDDQVGTLGVTATGSSPTAAAGPW